MPMPISDRIQTLALTAIMALAGGFLGSLALGGAPAARAGDEKVLSANRVEIHDDAGNIRGFFGMLPDGGVGVSLVTKDKKPRLNIVLQDDGGTQMSMTDEAGKLRIANQVLSDGKCAFLLGDATGTLVNIIAGEGAPTTLMLNGRGNKSSLTLSVLDDGRVLSSMNHDGKMRYRAMTTGDGTPEVILLNENKESVWKASGKK